MLTPWHRYVLTLFFSFAAHGATQVAPGVHLIPGAFVPGTQPDGNSVIFSGREGLIVVDTGRHTAHTQSIIDFAKSAHQPVKAVINTHSALNDARKSFLANYRKQLEEMIARTPDAEGQKPFRAELAIIDAGDQLLPDVVLTRSSKQSIAGRNLSNALESHAVTAGDLWIYDPKTRVLVAGDLVTFRRRSLTPHARRTQSSFAFCDVLHLGWITDAAPLLPEDRRFTRALMEYYVDVLRGNPAKPAALCGE